MFPVARGGGRHLHTLSELLTNQLLVYIFLHQTGGDRQSIDDESITYSKTVSTITEQQNFTQYSYGVKRSSGLVRIFYALVT